MSARLIALSPDLSRLREEGFEVDVRGGHVVVANVPYVTAERTVARGTLVIPLTTAGERTGPPLDHTAWWMGPMPSHQTGAPLARIDAGAVKQELAPGLSPSPLLEQAAASRPL